MANSSLNDAATLIAATELKALQAINDVLKEATDKLAAAVADLDYPASFPADSVRIANNVKMSLEWPVNELASKLAALQPAPAASPSPAPQA